MPGFQATIEFGIFLCFPTFICLLARQLDFKSYKCHPPSRIIRNRVYFDSSRLPPVLLLFVRLPWKSLKTPWKIIKQLPRSLGGAQCNIRVIEWLSDSVSNPLNNSANEHPLSPTHPTGRLYRILQLHQPSPLFI
ncbi:hypothetical protein V8C34DRAFT_51373 [Trichoderma compactum]